MAAGNRRGAHFANNDDFEVDATQFEVDKRQFEDQTELLDRSYYDASSADPTALSDPFSDAGVTSVPDQRGSHFARYPETPAYDDGEFVADPRYAGQQGSYPSGGVDQLDEPYAAGQAPDPGRRRPQASSVPEPGQANVRTMAHDYDRTYAQPPHQQGAGDVPSSNDGRKGSSVGIIAAALLLLLAGVGLLGFAGYYWFDSQQKYQVGIDEYSGLQQAVTEDSVSGRPIIDFAALKAQNPEIVGWVQIPGTVVNYPVVRHEDNDYYLDHTFLGTYNLAGSVFMDYRSNPAITDRTTVIYGHHLKNGQMFAKVADYSNQEEFDKIGNVYYISDDNAVHVLTPLCCFVVGGEEVEVLQFQFENELQFKEYVQSLITRSRAWAPNATAEGVPHVYLLSTCSYERDNDRTILVCVDWASQGAGISDATSDLESIQNAADTALVEGDANVDWH